MRKIVLLFVFFNMLISAFATHQRAGEITYVALSELEYEFTIVTYTYTPSPADRPELTVDWGDGTSTVVPRTQKINYPNNISRNVYAGAVHVFPGQGTYIVSVEDPNRNYGVLNIPNSVNVPFYIQTEVVINPFLGPNNSVELLAPPVDNGCVNKLYLHNPGAYDPDGDSLSYKLVDCRGAFGLPVPGYVLPNKVDTTVQTSFEIDPVTGTILWDHPLLQGEYNIAFLIEEWREGTRIGYVTRDMQIEIIACDNEPPQIVPIADTCVEAGTTLSFPVTANDPDGDELSLRAIGGPFIQEESPATFPYVLGEGSVSSTFTWAPTCVHVRHQPYQVVFTAKDTLTVPQLADIKTMNIRVISPAPENLSATPAGNKIHLSWNRAECDRAIGYEVFRRSGFYGFNPGPCETGVPAYTGYERIATPEGINDTTLIDDNNGMGLVHGIDYCYMVVAYFSDGGKSYASGEACATLKKDVPIITNVSVQGTSTETGSIYVAWSKPTELDTIIFQGPYKYVIKRRDNASGTFQEIDSTFSINDTTYLDQGLNTEDLIFTYQIDMYSEEDGNRFYVGSTQLARSMFLQVTPTDQALQLSWNVDAPWINEHYSIYRLNDDTGMFDSIGFSTQPAYTDSGLVNGRNYTYFVESYGKYTAPGLVDPIINLSQINSGTPVDNVPPCRPILSINTICDKWENELNWIHEPTCPEDILRHTIYYSPFDFEELTPVDSINGADVRQYIHSDIPSIAGCYAVQAVDSVGNRSDLSNVVCVSIDSCSTYRLPNFFTPNNDEFNQYFRPFEYTSVERINLKIFNRYGRIVFETQDPDINWDGKNMNNNQDCKEGVYFYVCDVYEIRLEGPTKRTIKGSVTLMR